VDENSQHEVLSQHQDPAYLSRENASLRERLAALERQNVVPGQFRGEVPRYSLNAACFLDDTFFDKGTTIEWTGEVNLDMVPLNEPARRVMERFVAEQEESGYRVAAARGRTFAGLTNDRNVLIEASLEDSRRQAQESHAPRVKMPEPIGEVPPMPHTIEAQAQQRRRGRPPRAVAVPGDPSPPDRGAPILAPIPEERSDPAIVARMVR
jgi:hypothetical protein